MKRAALYIRVSTDKQASEGDSLAAQRAALEEYVARHQDMTVADVYMDDGISGTKLRQRDELQRLLDDVRAHKVDIILFTKLDRWFRSVRHYTATQDVLDKYGVKWTAIWEPIYDQSTAQGRLIINSMLSIGQFEAEQTGQRIRQVQKFKVQQGEAISGSLHAGQKIVNKKIVPDDNADVIRQVFEYYAQSGNMDKTMRAFEWCDALPRTKPPWRRMLQDEKYVGRYRDNDHFCDPIIPQDLFDEVQRLLKMNIKANQRETYLFSGLMRCGACGRVMGGITRRTQRQKGLVVSHMYRCPGHYIGGIVRCDMAKVASENVIERWLLDNIRPAIKDLLIHIDAEQAPVRDNSKRIDKIQRKLDRLKAAYLAEAITLDEYKTDREALETELAEATSDAPTTEPKRTAHLQEIMDMDIEGIYWTMTPVEKRRFWRSIVDKITMGDDRVLHVFFLT